MSQLLEEMTNTYWPILWEGFLKRENGLLRKNNGERHVLFQEVADLRKKLRLASNHALILLEQERKRISRELHDELGQSLVAIGTNLHMLKQMLDRPKIGEAEALIGETQKLLEETSENMHRISHELRPALLDDLGLGVAIRQIIKEFSKRAGFKVDFRTDGILEQLDENSKMVVYRIIQECLTNISKYARARNVAIRIRREKGSVLCLVRDDGCGFSTEKGSTACHDPDGGWESQVASADSTGSPPRPERGRGTSSGLVSNGVEGLGLTGMRERLRMVNGELTVKSREGEGTWVRARLPLQQNKNQKEKCGQQNNRIAC